MKMRIALLYIYLIFLLPFAVHAQENDPLRVFLGTWSSREGKVIRVVSPTSDQIAFLGRHEDWIGKFEPVTGDRPPRAIFTRKPKSSEMDPAAPEWARQQVEGRLEWILDLELQECPEIKLKGRWYQGSLRWKKNQTGSAEVGERGPGVPVEYKLVSRSIEASKVPEESNALPSPPFAIEESRQAFLESKKELLIAAETFKAAEEKARTEQTQFLSNLAEADRNFTGIQQRIAKLEAKIRDDQNTLDGMKADEEGMRVIVDRLKEQQRQWEILKDYAKYVNPVLLKTLSRQISELRAEFVKSKQIRESRMQPLEQRLDENRRQLAIEYDKQLASIENFSNSSERKTDLMDMLLNTLEVEQARENLMSADDEFGKAFDEYSKWLTRSPPPFLSSVRIQQNGKTFYEARWERASVKPEEPDVALLQSYLAQLDSDIAELQKMRDDGREYRGTLALLTKGYGPEMERLAKLAADAEQTMIIANAVVESVFVVAEVALTGGTATAIRKANEVAAALQEKIAASQVKAAVTKTDVVEEHFKVIGERLKSIARKMEDELAEQYMVYEAMAADAARKRAAAEVSKLLGVESAEKLAEKYLKEAQQKLAGAQVSERLLRLPVEDATQRMKAATEELRQAIAHEYMIANKKLSAADALALAEKRIAEGWTRSNSPEQIAEGVLREIKTEIAQQVGEMTEKEVKATIDKAIQASTSRFNNQLRVLQEGWQARSKSVLIANGMDAAKAEVLASREVATLFGKYDKAFQSSLQQARRWFEAEMKIRPVDTIEELSTALVSKTIGSFGVPWMMEGTNDNSGFSQIYSDAGCNQESPEYRFEPSGTVLGAMGSQLAQDTVEVILARAMKAGFAGGREIPKSFFAGIKAWNSSKGPTRLARIKNGLNVFSGKFPSANVIQAIKPGAGDIFSLASIVTKQVITQQFAELKLKYEAQYAKASSDFTARYSQYYLAVCEEKRIWNEIQKLRQQQALIRGVIAAPHARKKLIITDTALAGRDPIEIDFVFSDPVDQQPVITIGEVPVTISPGDGDKSSARRWKGKINWDAFVIDKGRIKLDVRLAPDTQPYGSLDSNPVTAAYLDPASPKQAWLDYEVGADQHHTLRICPPQ